MFLSDSELVQTLEETNVVEGIEVRSGAARFAREAQVQPCSVDLRIGGIFIPGAEDPAPGSAESPRDGVVLSPGRTAVITTLEECNLPPDLGAIGFPPNTVSSKGILMTNPGHVDPGYKGPMSFTVINMGSEDYTLLKKDRIVTLLFFKLGKPATKDLAARGGVTSGVKSLLSVLSPDFLGISTRVKEAAESEEQKTRRIGLLAPTLAGIAAVLITLVTSIMPLQGDVSDLKATTAAMGEVRELEKKIAKLEGSLDREGLPLPLKDDGN